MKAYHGNQAGIVSLPRGAFIHHSVVRHPDHTLPARHDFPAHGNSIFVTFSQKTPKIQIKFEASKMKLFTTILLSLVFAVSVSQAKPTKWTPLKEAPADVDQAKFDDLSYPYQDDIDSADPVEVFGE